MAEDKGTSPVKARVPIAPDLFTIPSSEDEEAHLLGTRCNACGEGFFPRRVMCGKCFSGNTENILLGGKGRVYSNTVVRHPPPQYEGPIPYALGHVELREGVLVPAVFTGVDPEAVKIGIEVEMVIEKLKEDDRGNDVLTYKFRPV